MEKKAKLQSILDKMNSDTGLGNAFKSVEAEMKRVTSKMKRDAEIEATKFAKKSVEEVRNEMQSNSKALMEAFGVLQDELVHAERQLTDSLELKLNQLRTAVSRVRQANYQDIQPLSDNIEEIKEQIKLINSRKIEIPDFSKDIQALQEGIQDILLQEKKEEVVDLSKLDDFEKKLEEFEKDLKRIRSSVSNSNNHGGNANRNIMVSGNSSTLSRYTDINLKPGSNVTLTYVNNDNLKTTDITIASTGGGGGTSRNISTVSVSSMVAATASTDIVIIASTGVQLTMPTAVSNTNLYTIKNTSTSSVLVSTTGGQTIDSDASGVILNVQYTAIDLISDNANWHIT